MKTRLGLLLLAAVPATSLAWGEGCKFKAERTGAVDAAGADKVVIRAGAGDMKVKGQANAARVEARGRACTDKQALLDQVQVSVRREGNTIYVETTLPEDKKSDDGWSWGSDQAYIDLDISLPSTLQVDAIDSSGDAEFSDLGAVTVQDSSGDLKLRRIAGLAEVGDSSGDLTIEGAGNVRVRDSSGDVEIEDVKIDVSVDVDSSGDIRITQVGKDVSVHQDSSGEIRIEDVHGNVDVDSDSSGDIYAGHVTGNFTVSSDSSGSIEHDAIGGRVTVPENKHP